LFCYDNDLTSLDVSIGSLSDFRCFNNQLTFIDVSQCTALSLFLCNDNLLTALDVSQNALLTDLFCQNNELECLGANNGQNLNLDCSNNQLSCISVLNPNWSTANATYDVGVNFDVICLFVLDNDVDQNGTSMTAVQNGATYQWLDCENNYAIISEATGQTYNPTSTGYYAVEITLNDPCGGLYIDTSSCHFHYQAPDEISLEELSNNEVQLIKITDLMGRETSYAPNVSLIYYYSDGTIERVFKLEE